MTAVTTSPWEHQLLDWAHEGVDSHAGAHEQPLPVESLLGQAYTYCTALTRVHSRTFFLASGLLPAERRPAVRALYAFCRVTDNVVDQAGGDAPERLEAWRRRALAHTAAADDPVALAWTDARLRYGIPRRYAEQLIEGVSRDLRPARYASFEDLAAYCYGVASTVGLMAMHIIGFAGPEAIPYAVKLGVALQLTNILRDVGEDWRAGRVYLPQDELALFGLCDADLAEGAVSERWRAFMRYQIDRNRTLYAEAAPGIALLAQEGRLAITAAAELYRAILGQIEANDMDVFSRRARVSGLGKVQRLPGIWWKAKTCGRV